MPARSTWEGLGGGGGAMQLDKVITSVFKTAGLIGFCEHVNGHFIRNRRVFVRLGSGFTELYLTALQLV
jgi:hypothetical protein